MAFHLKHKTNIIERHFSRRFQVALIGEGLLVGLLGGGVVTLYRLCLSFAEAQMRSITESIAGNWPYMALWFGILLILMAAVCLLMKFEPYTAGSGIPQTNAEVMGSADMPWYRVLPVKFIQGVLVAFGGLSMGREGPAVQLGAVSGKAVSKFLKRKRGEERLLVTCGAAAGMSAAFHAPLTGTLFAIEEIQKEFHAPLIISAMTASVGADFLVSNVLGMKPVLQLPYVAPLPQVEFAFVLFVGFTCEIVPADVMHEGKGDTLFPVELRDAAIGAKGMLRLCRRREPHEFDAYVDDVATRGIAIGCLYVNAADDARDGCLHVGHAKILATGTCDLCDFVHAAVLEGCHATDQVITGEFARKGGWGDVAQALDSIAVTARTIAIGKVANEIKRKGLLARRRVRPRVHQKADGLLVLLALCGERLVIREKAGKDEGVCVFECLGEVHVDTLVVVFACDASQSRGSRYQV